MLLCSFEKHQGTWEEKEASSAICPDCLAARRQDADRIQRTQTIDPASEWGQHIPLKCRNHPEFSWHTKNIDFIGARSIFFNQWPQPECSCSIHELYSPGRFLHKLFYLLGTDTTYSGD